MKYTVDYHPEESLGLRYFWCVWSPPIKKMGATEMRCIALVYDEATAQKIADLLTKENSVASRENTDETK